MLLALGLLALCGRHQAVATLTIQPDSPTFTIPANYLGLSYESMQLNDPDFFSPSNRGLIEMFRRLSAHGVLRIGGNSSELGWFQSSPGMTTPPEVLASAARTGSGTNRTPYAITPRAIDNLAGFLRATGWTLIYGLNLGAKPIQNDADEASYVARAVGSRLIAFQIGNEPDLYKNAGNGARPRNWTFDDYVQDWTEAADAVMKAVPHARFSGPDVAGNPRWVVDFGDRMKPRLGSHLAMLSGHYYAMGPAGGKNITMTRLLSRRPSVDSQMDTIEAAAKPLGLVFRMTEGNSCYRGGQAGVSNAFGSALWAADYLLDMASHGNAGVNLHGGGGKQIGASLGNQIPGARNDADLAVALLGSFYTPIAGNRVVGFTARPVYFGMLLAGALAGKTLVQSSFDAAGANATAYAARNGRGFVVVLINKDPDADLTVRLVGVSGHAAAMRLTAPSLDATEGVTYPGYALPSPAPRRPRPTEFVNVASIPLPHASGALVWIGVS